ncbi:hypothetical protein Taro_010902, partial [Colocasia esculenta]|nr:hypothetical protein [Colocasia esculenta]
ALGINPEPSNILYLFPHASVFSGDWSGRVLNRSPLTGVGVSFTSASTSVLKIRCIYNVYIYVLNRVFMPPLGVYISMPSHVLFETQKDLFTNFQVLYIDLRSNCGVLSSHVTRYGRSTEGLDARAQWTELGDKYPHKQEPPFFQTFRER